MAGPIIPAITSGYTDFLQPRWNKVCVEVGSQIEELYKWIFNIDENMSWNPMQDTQISGLGQMRDKPEGTGFTYDSLIQGGAVTYRSFPYGLGFEWTIEMMRWDLYGIFDDISADLLRSAPHKVELVTWGLINDAFDGLLYTGYDGLSLAHTAHPYLDVQLGTFSNRSATDVSGSQTGIQEMLLHYDLLKDMRGMPNVRRPAIVLIHPSRKPAWREVLQSEYDPRSANNAINTIVDDDLKYFSSRYLTSTSAWHAISRPNQGRAGHDVWMHWGIKPLPKQFEDDRTMSSVQTIYQNFGVHFGDPYGWWSSKGTGA